MAVDYFAASWQVVAAFQPDVQVAFVDNHLSVVQGLAYYIYPQALAYIHLLVGQVWYIIASYPQAFAYTDFKDNIAGLYLSA